MAFVFTPTCPGTGPWYIDREDCIGDSLVYINANTGYFDCKINSLSTSSVSQISAGPNIIVTPSSGLGNTVAVTAGGPGIAKAWVNFNGNSLTINSRYNIQSVTGGGGVYTITYTTSVGTNNCVVATCSDDSGGYNAVVQTQSTGSCRVNTWRASPLSTTAASNINVVVFGF